MDESKEIKDLKEAVNMVSDYCYIIGTMSKEKWNKIHKLLYPGKYNKEGELIGGEQSGSF